MTDKKSFDIIMKCFYEHKNYENISKELNLTLSCISRTIKEILNEIKQELDKHYLASKKMKASNSLSDKDIEKLLFNKELWKNLI